MGIFFRQKGSICSKRRDNSEGGQLWLHSIKEGISGFALEKERVTLASLYYMRGSIWLHSQEEGNSGFTLKRIRVTLASL